MGTGLLLAALVAIGPFAADEDLYGQNPVLLLNDPKIARVVGVTEDQKPYLQQDLNDHIALRVDASKLQVATGKTSSETDPVERAKLKREILRLEPIVAEFEAHDDAIQQACVARLTPEQYQRLRELAWQLLGVEVFSNQRYKDKLGMTKADMAMAKSLLEESSAKLGKLKDGLWQAEPQLFDAQKTLGAAERELIAKIVSQLQPSTKATYESFAGEPAAVSKW